MRGEEVRATLSVPDAAGLHAVNVCAVMPDGRVAPWSHRTILTSGEDKEVTLPIAWNDARGRWTLKAVDLYTDRAVTSHFTVE